MVEKRAEATFKMLVFLSDLCSRFTFELLGIWLMSALLRLI